ncbi:hypothetical protein FU323_02885 [Lactobacillus delbrueckii subsp. bulgaricus]|nr:hypothetical protein FU323_02885 [Lactobacillus delbrueckii subsp. bulgaricus]
MIKLKAYQTKQIRQYDKDIKLLQEEFADRGQRKCHGKPCPGRRTTFSRWRRRPLTSASAWKNGASRPVCPWRQ